MRLNLKNQHKIQIGTLILNITRPHFETSVFNKTRRKIKKKSLRGDYGAGMYCRNFSFLKDVYYLVLNFHFNSNKNICRLTHSGKTCFDCVCEQIRNKRNCW